MDEITFFCSPGGSHSALFTRAAEGLRLHGVKCIISKGPISTKAVACWGWKRGRRLKALGHKVLVFERGYLGDRFYWTSIAWDGLNNRGNFLLPKSVTAQRFEDNFSLKPWKKEGSNIIIMGQVRGDMSLGGRDLTGFYKMMAELMKKFHDKPVYFREHPASVHRNFKPGLPTLTSTLDEALADAHMVVSWNSNSGVDAVVAGIPALSFDVGSMAWDVTGHSPDERIMPTRQRWAERLAHCQWTPEEINTGAYWPRMRAYIGR